MGDEADADWQDGLIEWGIEDARNQLRVREDKYRLRRGMPKRRAQSEDASRKRGE